MALNVGDQHASSGMAKAVFDALNKVLDQPPDGLKPEDKAKLLANRQALSFAIASGIVAELTGAPSVQPDFAQTYSSAAQDPAFWSWFNQFVDAVGAAVPAVKNLSRPTEMKGILR
jgi:hypothetical protein